MYCSSRFVFRGTCEGAPALLFLPLAQVKNGSCLAHAQSDARNTFISCQSKCPALGWLWVDILAYVRSTYSASIAHAIHAQFPFALPSRDRTYSSSTTNRVTPKGLLRGWSSGVTSTVRGAALSVRCTPLRSSSCSRSWSYVSHGPLLIPVD